MRYTPGFGFWVRPEWVPLYLHDDDRRTWVRLRQFGPLIQPRWLSWLFGRVVSR